MTITLTPDELGAFAQDLGEWNNSRLVDFAETFTLLQLRELSDWRDNYEKKHPRPNWRELLK